MNQRQVTGRNPKCFVFGIHPSRVSLYQKEFIEMIIEKSYREICNIFIQEKKTEFRNALPELKDETLESFQDFLSVQEVQVLI